MCLIIYNYCTWTRSIWGFMEQSTTILNSAFRLIQYCSSSSVVIVLLHTALFYFNFEILWKLWNFWNFLKMLSFWIFLKSYEILWKFWIFFKKNWNFKIKKKLTFKLFFYFDNFDNFDILWNFLTYWLAKSNFCAIKNHIALSCHVISFIDFARECNMIIHCTEIAFC